MSSYKVGDFLQHDEYGIGQVKDINEGQVPEVEIDFKQHGTHILPEHLVKRSTSRLSPDGFHAFAYLEPEKAKLLLQDDPVEAICKVLEDFRKYRAKTEDFKKYLSLYISDWGAWWELTQPLLKKSARIDSTKSQVREYGLMQEELLPVQAAYRSFRRYRKYESFPLVYDQARRVLREIERGETLSDDEIDDLLGYFRQVIASGQYPIGERLDAFFRLVEGKWLSPEQIQAQFAELLKAGFRIYELEPFAQQRVVKHLLQQPLDEVTFELLATGMGGQPAVVQTLSEWALRRSVPGEIARLILAGLSLNLPPDLAEREYRGLNDRLKAIVELVKCLPLNYTDWKAIFTAFQDANRSIASVPDLEPIKLVLPAFTRLAWELLVRVRELRLDETIVLDSLVDPVLRTDYIVSVLEAAKRFKLPDEFTALIEDRLLNTAGKRGDDFLYPLLSHRWKSHSEQAAGLVEFVSRYPSPALIERAGRVLCEIGQQAEGVALVKLLPYLDHFHRLEGNWSWSGSLEAMRETAFFELFIKSIPASSGNWYQDPALIQAAQQYAAHLLDGAQQEIREQKEQLSQYQVQLHELESQLKEKETILRELRSLGGGEEAKGWRFEERSRILKEVASVIAEFERYAASQTTPSREILAVLRRLENLVAGYKVLALEPVGSKVEFSPQKHRLVEGADISPGDMVMVVERGFLIRDLQDRLRLLKPALVKKS